LRAQIKLHEAGGVDIDAPVDFVNNVVAGNSGTIEMRASVANEDAALVPGQLVDVVVALDVLRDALGDTPTGNVQGFLSNEVAGVTPMPQQAITGLERVAEVPIYQTDAVVRRSSALQMTLDATLPVARMHSALIAKLGLTENGRVSVRQTASALTLKVQRDDLLPENCVRIPSGHPLTAGQGHRSPQDARVHIPRMDEDGRCRVPSDRPGQSVPKGCD
jgi:hypothetical protein